MKLRRIIIEAGDAHGPFGGCYDVIAEFEGTPAISSAVPLPGWASYRGNLTLDEALGAVVGILWGCDRTEQGKPLFPASGLLRPFPQITEGDRSGRIARSSDR